MELSLREWIMVASVVLMAAILGHALWLRWRSRRNRLRLEIDPVVVQQSTEVDDLELLRGELPNGGARVIDGEGPTVRSGTASSNRPLSSRLASAAAAEPTPPVLLDSVGGARRIEPEVDSNPVAAVDEPMREPTVAAPTVDAEPKSRAVRPPSRNNTPAPEPTAQEARPAEAQAEELIVMQVLARDPNGFEIGPLTTRASNAGMTYGHFNIFHRYKDGRSNRKLIEYSMANAVEPGVFDLSDGGLRTRGVAFFMQLPAPSDPMAVFDDMLRVATDIAGALDGELRDERQSVITAQTIEHCRERIRDFNRRQQIRS